MSILLQFQQIFPDGTDYLIGQDGVTGVVALTKQPEDKEVRAVSYNSKLYTVQQVAISELPKFYPLISLVTGETYKEVIEGEIPFMTDLQVKALQTWLNYQQTAFNKAKEAFLSLDVVMAQNIFSNPNNGLQDFVYALGEAVKTGALSPTTVIPGITPALTVQGFSLLLDFWVIVKTALATPTEHSGITVQDYITRI